MSDKSMWNPTETEMGREAEAAPDGMTNTGSFWSQSEERLRFLCEFQVCKRQIPESSGKAHYGAEPQGPSTPLSTQEAVNTGVPSLPTLRWLPTILLPEQAFS